jgi:hypothetical protein
MSGVFTFFFLFDWLFFVVPFVLSNRFWHI